MKFEELKVTRQYINALEEAGFTEATGIQEKAIPPIRAGQDLIGIAQTGTGKTAAYLIPIMQALQQNKGLEPRALVLVPTKELAVQVGQQFDAIATYTNFKRVVLYGGVGPTAQAKQLAEGCDVIISTPGRFLDLYINAAFSTKKIKHVVLDEADRMMDMGFMHQIRSIQEVLPSKRQNLLFSATFPEYVEHLADEFLLFPLKIEITPQATPVETVEQFIYHINNFQSKLSMLRHLLEDEEVFNKVIIFTKTKELAVNLGKYLERKGMGPADMLHSNRAQNARMNAVKKFRANELRILVTTDVSARGLDIPEVSHVINFSIPKDHRDYIHRIGRTGRALRTGVAISFCDPAEIWHVKKIEALMKTEIPVVPIPEEVEIFPSSKEEKQEQAKELDHQRRKDNPSFKGAFHDKKRKTKSGSSSRYKRK